LTSIKGYKDGPLANSMFFAPSDLDIDIDGNIIIADQRNHCIRKLLIDKMEVILIAGIPNKNGFSDGNASEALFNCPFSVKVDSSNNIYVADMKNGCIRKISDGIVSTFVSTDPSLARQQSRFYCDHPCSIDYDEFGNLYVTDYGHNRICKLVGAVPHFSNKYLLDLKKFISVGQFTSKFIIVRGYRTPIYTEICSVRSQSLLNLTFL